MQYKEVRIFWLNSSSGFFFILLHLSQILFWLLPPLSVHSILSPLPAFFPVYIAQGKFLYFYEFYFFFTCILFVSTEISMLAQNSYWAFSLSAINFSPHRHPSPALHTLTDPLTNLFVRPVAEQVSVLAGPLAVLGCSQTR